MSVKWTGEQQGVISATHQSFMVVASAGSGKTSVLVERYLRHITEEGLTPDQILTITFTRKAAAEMKERIVKRLRSMSLFEAAQIAETGPIQTIHGFCERLLRENVFEAHLDPEFEILGDAQSAELTDQAFRTAMASDLQDLPLALAVVTELVGLQSWSSRGRQRPYSVLEKSVLQVVGELRGAAWTLDEIESLYSSPDVVLKRWADQVRDAFGPEASLGLEGENLAVVGREVGKYFRKNRMNPPYRLSSGPGQEVEEQIVNQTIGLVQLACQTWKNLEALMSQKQQFDFTAMETMAVRLLEQSAFARKRLRDQYPVVMVDEAQDVNPVQYRLLQSLGATRQMLVGDPQQSIYGFRLADVERFRERISEGESLRLTQNHRSTVGIQAYVDEVFGSIWAADYAPMRPALKSFDLDHMPPTSFEGVEHWEVEGDDQIARWVAEMVVEGESPGKIAILVRVHPQAESLLKQLEQLSIPARIIGGSSRFYTRLHVRDLANVLCAVADPYDNFSLLCCLRSPLVGLSLDAITLLSQKTPVVEALADFSETGPEDREKIDLFLEWFDSLRLTADRVPAWEVLGEILAKSNYLQNVAQDKNKDQIIANIRKLQVLATEEPHLGPLEFAERIREIVNLAHRETQAPTADDKSDQVTIMTIHKSKGLEFEVVVLPSLNRNLKRKRDPVIADGRSATIVASQGLEPNGIMSQLIHAQKVKREVEEELRLLYVAMTRAKRRLVVCLYPPKNVDTLGKRLKAAVGDHPAVLVKKVPQVEGAVEGAGGP